MSRRRASFALAVALAASAGGAQTVREEADALVRAKQEAVAAAARSRRFEQDAAEAAGAADRARAEAAATAARIQAAEAEIAVAETRVALIEQLRARQRARLAARQGGIVRLTAALQTLARRPPALALVRPGSVNDLAHVRALLASTLPVVRQRTAALRAEVAEGQRLRQQAGLALAALHTGQERLAAQRYALVRLEARERTRSATLVDSAMYESDRALALGEQARDIADLMVNLQSEASIRARLATLPGPLPRPRLPTEATPQPDAMAQAPARAPVYSLPVKGQIVAGLGELADSGVRSRGITIAAREGALAVAPAAGRVSYAGPFRSYGTIVIIDHGGGWQTLVTGMAASTVAVGNVVERGSPIGSAAGSSRGVTVELRRGGQPMDITRLAAPI